MLAQSSHLILQFETIEETSAYIKKDQVSFSRESI